MADVGLEIKIKADTGQARMSLEQFRAAMGANMEAVVKQSVIGSSAVSKAVAETAAATQKSSAAIADSLVKGIEKSAVATNKLKSETDLLIEKSQAAVRAAQSTAQAAENAIGNTTTKIASATTEAESLGSRFSALAGPLGIATGILAGLGAAAVGVSVAMFDIAKSSAEFGDKIYDATQKVNFSATTLTALKVAAEQSGGTFEGLTTALGLFNKNIELAAEGSKKQSALFKTLNIDTSDNQKALEGAFTALSKLENGAQQTALAMQLFGRSGKDMLGVIKQAGGDLPAFIAQMEQAGLTLSDKDVEAANDFSDALTQLTRQLELVKVKVGEEALPVLTNFFTSLSSDLADSQGDIKAWGDAFAGATKVAIATIESFLSDPRLQLLRVYLAAIGAASKAPALDPDSTLGEVAAGTDPENRRLSKIQAELLAKGDRLTDLDKTPKVKKERAPKKTAEDYGIDLLQKLNGQLTELNDKTSENAIGVELLTKKYKGLSEALKLQILDAAITLDVRKKQIAADKEVADFTDKSNAALRQFALGERTASQQLDDFIEKMKLKGVFVDGGGPLRLNAILTDTTEILKKLDATAEDANAHIVELFKNSAGITQKPTLPDQGDAPLPLDPSIRGLLGDQFAGNLKRIREEMGLTGQSLRDLGADFKAVALTAADFFGKQSQAAGNFATIARNAFQSLTFAIGQTLEALILTGKTGPGWLRKMTAEILAQIAVQSAVKAIFEAAEGFAMLFINPAASVTHFKAAALYGAAAVAAGVTGRAIAGDAFNQPSAGGGGGFSGTSGGVASGSTTQTQTIIQNRNQSPQTIILHIESNDSHIVKAVHQDVNNNGTLRDLIVKVAQ